jgi:hypothetical protein
VFGQPRTLTEQAGREPAEVGIEVWVSMGSGTEADWARETRLWKEAGCSRVASSASRIGHLLASLHFGSMPHQLSLKNIDLFCRDVLPHLEVEDHP